MTVYPAACCAAVHVLLNYMPSPGHFERLRAAAPGALFTVATDEDSARRAIVDADVVLGNRSFLQTLPCATRLRWMQSNSMGVDTILRSAGPRLDGVVLTCARGVYADEVADHAMSLLLGVARGLREAIEAYGDRRWGRWSLATLAGRRGLVLGWGAIGRAIGRRLQGFGVSVSGVRRCGPIVAAPEESGGVVVHGPDTWRGELKRSDLLIIALPLTPDTEGCIGADELASLPDDAIVVNVGRGETVDEAALIDGASHLQILVLIILPLMMPGVVATATYSFLVCWSEYLFALAFLTTTELKTMPLVLQTFFGDNVVEWNHVMAASVLTTLPTLLIFLPVQSQLTSGLGSGAVK